MIINKTECSNCSHQEVCSLTMEYRDIIASIKNARNENFVDVTVVCKFHKPQSINIRAYIPVNDGGSVDPNPKTIMTKDSGDFRDNNEQFSEK